MIRGFDHLNGSGTRAGSLCRPTKQKGVESYSGQVTNMTGTTWDEN